MALTHAVGSALTFWRRSLLARVVASTFVLTIVAVSVVGGISLWQTRSGLVEQRVDEVLTQSADEVADAEDRLAAASGIDGDASAQRRELVEPMIQRAQARGYWVVFVGPVREGRGRIADGGVESSPGLVTSSVPSDLEDRFQTREADLAWTYSRIHSWDPGTDRRQSRTSVPGVVVGAQVTLPADGSVYTAYFLYPLTQEQETLDLVAQGLGIAALALLLLLCAVSWLVVRQVVTPIRLARQVAERLAAGRLHERMPVRSEDDLARLAVSFNQMASNLQNQIRQLEELSRLQRRFTSDVSHELRTPLATVRMAGDMLHDARADFDPTTARAAELLQTELDRFETLLTDLLEISRFDAGAAVLDLEDLDLVDLVHRVVDGTWSLADRAGVEVVVSAPEYACRAEGDARRLERIVRNLVANAIDHSGDSPRIEVWVDADDHAAAIAVRDHGVGLAPGETAMVFNRFWRADPARDRSSGGTGLGLSISQEDARLHGGWLQAWGRPGQGAQFRLTLPRRSGASLRHSPLPLVPPDAREQARLTEADR